MNVFHTHRLDRNGFIEKYLVLTNLNLFSTMDRMDRLYGGACYPHSEEVYKLKKKEYKIVIIT